MNELAAVVPNATAVAPVLRVACALRLRVMSTCTGAVASLAADADEVILETAAATASERGATRADDRASEAAMEDRKRQGYF